MFRFIQAFHNHWIDIRDHRDVVKIICKNKISNIEKKRTPLNNNYIDKKIAMYNKIAKYHDLSRYSPREFIPTALWVYGPKGHNMEILLSKYSHLKNVQRVKKNKDKFEKATLLHYKRNKHHWCKNYNMTEEDIEEMIIDIEATLEDSIQDYYIDNYDIFKISNQSRFYLETKLNLIPKKHKLSFKTIKDFVNENDEFSFNEKFKDVIMKYRLFDLYKKMI